MENLAQTLLVAASLSALVLFLSPVYALIAYIGSLVVYPYYLTVQLGTLNFPVSRIVILALYANLLVRGNLGKNFKFIWPDKLIIILFVCQVIAGATTAQDFMQFLENRAGRFFDMALPYFAVRLIITSRQRYILLLKGILCITGILAIFSFYESLTGHNLLSHGFGGEHQYRLGLARAYSTFGNCNYLGVFFAMVGGICVGLLKNAGKRTWLCLIGVGLVFLGVFSSLSSGGLFAAITTILFIATYRYRSHWKQGVTAVIIMLAIVEVMSNRHFFEVIDRFTLNNQTAWYRSRLIEVALFEGGMSDHWMTGYGFAEPGWCEKIDSRSYTDMVNHYLLILCRYGLVGFIPFCGLIVSAVRKLFEKFWLLNRDGDTWLVWCLAGSLLGVLLACHTLSLFGATRNFFYIVLALCAALPTILHNGTASRINLLPN